MKPGILAIIGIFVIFAALEALRTGLLRKPGQRRRDGWVEIVSSLSLVLLTQPLVHIPRFANRAKP